MAKKIAISTLQASTIDILNVIRKNASQEYQDLVPTVTKADDIPRVGEVMQGYPALANQFLNALVNRIAAVRIKSATFNNPYARLKKGFLEYGETTEEIFVSIARVREFDVEKASKREFARNLPDVRSTFHAMNWRVQYPVTIQDQDLYQAFLSLDGVQNMIENITRQVYTAAEYDEYLLFKYLIIKAVNRGAMKPVSIGDGVKMNDAAIAFRGTSNQITFMSNEYNEAGVRNNTPRERQVIFMDSTFNAKFDVEVLAASFHMDKATYMGSLFLIDSFDTFDNDRFATIRANSDMIDEVTAAELAVMKNVKAVVVDEDWFQVYDNNAKFTEKYVASGMYWNYFYNVWKTVSTSPYANSIVFVTSAADVDLPETYTIKVNEVSKGENATVITLSNDAGDVGVNGGNIHFIQTKEATQAGIGIQEYGAVMIPSNAGAVKLELEVGGVIYEAGANLDNTAAVGDTLTFSKKS